MQIVNIIFARAILIQIIILHVSFCSVIWYCNILAYYLDNQTLSIIMILGRVICLSDLGNILAYYLDETTLLYKCKYYLCPGLIDTKCKYYLCPGLINTTCKYYLCPGFINTKCKYYLCPGLINTKCIYTLHNSIFIPAFFICVQGEHRSSQFQLIPYLRVR